VSKSKVWIRFEIEGYSKSGKTATYAVLTLDGVTLGVVRWMGRWRKYAYWPANYTVYEQECLRVIADFCERKTSEHNASRKAKRENPSA
jgi:hypothetical protein